MLRKSSARSEFGKSQSLLRVTWRLRLLSEILVPYAESLSDREALPLEENLTQLQDCWDSFDDYPFTSKSARKKLGSLLSVYTEHRVHVSRISINLDGILLFLDGSIALYWLHTIC